jgi:hypothetical protein
MINRGFSIHGVPLRLRTNDSIISQAFSGVLGGGGQDAAEGGIVLGLWRAWSFPVEIPIQARHLLTATNPDCEHFQYRSLWLVDGGAAFRMVVDFDGETILGYFHPRAILAAPLLPDYAARQVFQLLKRRGLYLAHAGAVSLAGKGLLVVGGKMAGKSTLTIRLTGAGFGYLGDDMCLLRRRTSGFEALALPRAAHLYPPNVADLPEFRFLQDIPDGGEPKKTVQISQVYPDRLVNQAPINALVFPRWQPKVKSRVAVLPACEALIALLPQSMERPFPEVYQAQFTFLADLVAQVPCFQFFMGYDKETWPHRITEILSSNPT